MNDFRFVFEVLGVLGFLVAVLAEIDISMHRRDHERRSRTRRSADKEQLS